MGIGFAVPVNLARFAMESIIKEGRVIRGYMGVSIQDVSDALAKEFKLKDSQGALVGDVTPKGPAERAGIRSGDVIVEFNGKPVEDSRTLKLQVAQVAPGTEASVKVVRDGSKDR
jgi:serine protease Do